MSEEETPPEETVSKPASKVRRISNPRPRKKAKKVVEAESAPAAEEAPPSETVIPEAPAKVSPPVVASEPESAEDEITNPDLPESFGMEEGSTASVGGSPNTNEAKRKRRRRKGKGSGSNSQSEDFHPSGEGNQESSQGSGNRPPQPQNNSRPPALDADAVSTKAWKIFLAEVSEEGVALINDQDARDLARRCFRLSEIFLEERTRRRRD